MLEPDNINMRHSKEMNHKKGKTFMVVMIKKKTALLAVLTLIVCILSACGRSETDSETDKTYISRIKASDYVTLGAYKGIELDEEEPSVPEGYVSQYIDTYILAPRATTTPVEDRTDVQEGDTVNIDYVGYRDGVAFDGGTAQGYDLTIGSGAFISGFEDGLIGGNVGDTVTLDLTFPDDYHSEEMAGASVSFEVTINSISILEKPELTDELVQELAIGDCSNVEELNSYLNDYFYSSVLSSYNQTVKNDITNAVIENCTFNELPEELIDRYYDILIEDMTKTADSYGMDLNTYIQNYYNMDEAAYTERVRDNAQSMAKQYIMFQAIADVEDLNLTDEEKAQAAEKWAQDYGYGSVDDLKEDIGEEEFNEYLMAEEVVAFLLENATINTNEVN